MKKVNRRGFAPIKVVQLENLKPPSDKPAPGGKRKKKITIEDLQKEVWQTAEDKGWHKKTLKQGVNRDASIGERIALVHAEASEALEEVRNGHYFTYYEDGKPEGLPIELADIIIRVLDLAEVLGISMTEALEIKAKFNNSRPERHGGKLI